MRRIFRKKKQGKVQKAIQAGIWLTIHRRSAIYRTAKFRLMNYELLPEGASLNQARLANHLNRLYCAKSHFTERMADIAEYEALAEMNELIQQKINSTEGELLYMDFIFQMLSTSHSLDNCKIMIDFLDELFFELEQKTSEPEQLRALLLEYLQHLSIIEEAAIHQLEEISAEMENIRLEKLLQRGIGTGYEQLTDQLK